MKTPWRLFGELALVVLTAFPVRAGMGQAFAEACADDIRQRCAGQPLANCLVGQIQQHRETLSRACVDFHQRSLAASDEFPPECFKDVFMRGPGMTAAVPVATAWRNRDTVYQTCMKRYASGESREAFMRHSPAYVRLESLLNALALVDRAYATPSRWRPLINDASDFMRLYDDDPDPGLRASSQKFLEAFGEPRRWDSRVRPTPAADVPRAQVVESFQDGLEGYQRLLTSGQWTAPSTEESALLQHRLELLFPKETEPRAADLRPIFRQLRAALQPAA